LNYIIYQGGCFVDNETYCGRYEKRQRWKSQNGKLYFEFDNFHGDHFEVYNKRGEHIYTKTCDGTRVESDKNYIITPSCTPREFKFPEKIKNEESNIKELKSKENENG